jgi:hypothetical protein
MEVSLIHMTSDNPISTIDKRIQFLILVLLFWTFIFLTNYILISDNLYFNSLAEKLSYEQINLMIEQGKRWAWLPYAIMPIILLLKLALVSLSLSIAVYFVGNKFNFNELFGVALRAEYIFIIPVILKIIWFSFAHKDYNLIDLQFFYPLSALNIFDINNVQEWLIYPLQTLNIFEIIYWFLLANGLAKVINRDISKSFSVVLAGYGTGLTLWIIIIMFLMVTYK